MIKISFSKQFYSIFIALFYSAGVSNLALGNEEFSNFPTGEHEGGGVRGELLTSCATGAKNPVPLTPQSTHALTVSAAPELLFYVPDEIQASALEMVLLDRDNRVVFQNEFKSGYQPGIVSISLLDNSNSDALEIGSLYHWYLIQDCEGVDTPDVLANGLLQRIELDRDLAHKLNNASKFEKVRLYREAKLGHEAIATLAKLECDVTAGSSLSKQWIPEENFINNLDLFSQSLNTYCSNNEET